jgi:hypothetical protein
MSIIAKLSERLDAYAAKMESLEAEVKTLRAMTPLEAFTAGLKDATPEQVAEWFSQCQDVAALFAPASASEAKKEPKVKKAATNATGPTEWNVFIQATWRSMAADAGVLYEDFEGETKDKDFKEAAKKVGVTYQGVMKEASRRKAEAEGRDPEAPKAKKPKAPKDDSLAALTAKASAMTAAKKAAKAAAAAAAAAVPAQAEAEAEDAMAQFHADAKECGYVQIQHKGVLHYQCPEDGEVYNFPDLNPVGKYKDGAFEAYF